MPSLELRPRLASEIVDGAVQLYRRHFQALVTLSAVVYAPYVIAQLLLLGGGTAPGGITEVVILSSLGWVFGSIADAAIVLSVSNSYLRDDPDAGGALRQTLSRLGTVLLAVAAKWLIIGAAFGATVAVASLVSALVITASGAGAASATTAIVGVIVALVMILVSLPLTLFFWARYFAVPATVMLEGTGVGESLRRSKLLSRGFKWKVLAALGLSTLVLLIMQFVLGAALGVLPVPGVLRTLLSQAVTVLVYPLLSVIATLLYYDARIRKEGFDITVMAAELGVTAAATPDSPPA